MKFGDYTGKITRTATAVMNQKTGYKTERAINRNKTILAFLNFL
jgi:hypothetical protein